MKRKTRLLPALLLLFSLAPHRILTAQNVPITLEKKDAKVENLLEAIEKQSNYYFVYKEQDVDLSRKVSVHLENADIRTVLESIFAGTAVSYKIEQDTIVLFGRRVSGPDREKVPSSRTRTGRVVDSNGEPLIGAGVMVKGDVKGAVTDIEGRWSIEEVPDSSVLLVSCLGFMNQEIKAGTRTRFDVILREDTTLLDEIVVIGYGTLEKKAVTSSITSISAKDMMAGLGGSTIATALKGKISGMTINASSSPNSSADFQLRGVASINAGTAPLVVIDGMPGGDLRSLNQEDIQSIDILKDASAGAIYGTRAGAGVILVTTKKAQEGPVHLSYTGELSAEQVTNRPRVLDRDAFLRFGRGSDHGATTDWYGALLNEGAVSQRHVVNISGGSHKARVYTSFMTQDYKGIALGDNRKDYSGRINANFSLLEDMLEVGVHTEYREAHRDQRASKSYFDMAMRMNPTEPVKDPKSSSGWNVLTGSNDYYNPVAEIMLRQVDNIDKWISADGVVRLNLPSGFSLSATMGWEHRQYQSTHYTSALHRQSLNGNYAGRGSHGFSKDVNVSLEPVLDFSRKFGGAHKIDAVIGYSFWEGNSENFDMSNANFPVDGVGAWDMGTGTWLSDGKGHMWSYKYPRNRLISFFGRANYNYRDRYMVTASVRHEGSSKFGKNHRWGTFWAVSGGWRISNEDFMKDADRVDDLKIRVGYGVTGNNNFSPTAAVPMFSANSMWPHDGRWIISYGPANNSNNDLHWEQKSELNAGLDWSFFKARLFGKFDFFRRNVSGMLYSISVPNPPAIYEKTMMNFGNLNNLGWEFELGGVPVRAGDFQWNTTARFSRSSTRITSLSGDNTYQDRVGFPSPGSNGSAGRIEEGTRIGSYYIWKHAGFTDDGKWLLYDKEDNVISCEKKTYEDKRYIGNAIPAIMISWDHTFTWRGLSLGVNMHSWLDYDVFNTINMYYGLANGGSPNVLRDAYIDNRKITDRKQLCDYWLEDGSFFKIDAVSLAYELNVKKWQKIIDKAACYFTVHNVATFTNYSGIDPEVNVNGLDPGYEWFDDIYPATRRYTFGLKFRF